MPEIEPRDKWALNQLSNICMHPLKYFILKRLHILHVQTSFISLPALVLGFKSLWPYLLETHFVRALKFPGLLNPWCAPNQNCLVATELRRNDLESSTGWALRCSQGNNTSRSSLAPLLNFVTAISLGELASTFRSSVRISCRCHWVMHAVCLRSMQLGL